MKDLDKLHYYNKVQGYKLLMSSSFTRWANISYVWFSYNIEDTKVIDQLFKPLNVPEDWFLENELWWKIANV